MTERFERHDLTIMDQYETRDSTTWRVAMLCNPVDQDGEGMLDPARHLVCYELRDTSAVPPKAKSARFVRRDAQVGNQFGSETRTIIRPRKLCVPATKQELD